MVILKDMTQSSKIWKAMWREGGGEEGLVLRGLIIYGPGLTVAWQSAPDKPETVDCGASLHVNPSTGRTALQSKVSMKIST